MTPLLTVKNLSVDFYNATTSQRVVDQISFSVAKGQTLGIVGESGSGKTVTSLSLMRLLNERKSRISGEILFKDQNLLTLSATELRRLRGKEMAMIFQEPMTSLNPVFKVGDQIAESLRIHRMVASAKEARERVIELMQEVGIPDPTQRYNYYPHELSGGQRQRIMIAMAIACRPELLIADEPTTALDVTIQKQVLDLLDTLKAKYNMSMIFITHDLGLVSRRTDRVCIMYKGQIVEQGSTDRVFQQPQHPYTQGLLNCRPLLHAGKRRLPTLSDYLAEDGTTKQFDAASIATKTPKNLAAEPVVLKAEAVSKFFPKKSLFLKRVIGWHKACDGIDFELRQGEILGLVGESGSGKSTLGKTLMLLHKPTGGRVVLLGKGLQELPRAQMIEHRKNMQFIFQDPYSSLNPKRTILSALTEPMYVHGIGASSSERKTLAEELMKKVGLSPSWLSRYPHEFSGGQRQRICIARALALKPQVLICDESVSALDVSVQAQVLNLLLDLRDSMGISIVFISHDLSVVRFVSDRIMVMKDGVIVEQGTGDQIFENPKSEYTKTLIHAIPL